MRVQHTMEYEFTKEILPLVQDALYDYAIEGWEEEEFSHNTVVVRVHIFEDIEDPETICTPKVLEDLTEKLESQFNLHSYSILQPAIDWVEKWKQYCTPVECALFYVVPEWYTGEIPAGKHCLKITPKMAFGTGHHPTTALCLDAIARIRTRIQPHMRFCDIGTGSGILSIAMAQLGVCGIGYDIDAVSIANARENARLNAVEDAIEFFVGSLEDAYNIQSEIVFANILAEPLIQYKTTIINTVQSGGILVLSGILQNQENLIISEYTPYNIRFTPMHKGEWSALIGYKP